MPPDRRSQPADTGGLTSYNPSLILPPRRPPAPPSSVESLLLDLPGLRLMAASDGECPVLEEACSITIRVEQIPDDPPIHDCGRENIKIIRYGFKKQTITCEPRGYRRVYLKARRQKFRCSACNAIFMEPLVGMAEEHEITQRLLEFIQVESLFRSDLNLAEWTGISARTVRTIRLKFIRWLDKTIVIEIPRVVGLDGVRADHTMTTNVTDIKARLPIGLFRSGKKEPIAKHFKALGSLKNIEIFAIDMSLTEEAVIKKLIKDGLVKPTVVIVIDPYHVVRKANEAMDAVRIHFYPTKKSEREPGQRRPRPEPFRKRRGDCSAETLNYLAWWFGERPELRVAYDLKEAFFEIWDAESYPDGMSKKAAIKRYEEWKDKVLRLEGVLYDAFQPIINMLAGHFGDYIFNYFDHPYSNAYTESANRKIKDINRDLRWCSFESHRGRYLFGARLKRVMQAAREEESRRLKPHLKRSRQQLASQKKVEARVLERSPGDEPQEYIQQALDFSN
jgi:transposase